MLKLAILVAALVLLTAVIPWPWSLAPALLLAPLAPLLCCRSIRRTCVHPDWQYLPENMEANRLRSVCVPPSLLVGRSWLQAELWMPFSRIDGERFRGQKGMMRLAAAIALTDDCIDPNGPVSGCSPEEIAEWENSLSISAANIHRQNPRLDSARVSGFPGAVVMDGKDLRAYFVGSPAIIQACHRVLDGEDRPMTAEDRTRLADTPANTLCYASSLVKDGKLESLCYLGAVRPVRRSSPSPEALRAGERLHGLGISVCLARDDRWTLETVREMGIEWPEDEGGADVLEVLPAHEGDEQPRDFSEPVLRLLEHRKEERYYRLLTAMFGLLLWPAATLCHKQYPFLISLACFCAAILLTRELALPRPPRHSNRSFLIPMIPGVLLPAALYFFIGQYQHAGDMLCAAEASVYALFFLSLLLQDRKAIPRIAGGAAVCLIGVLTVFLIALGGTDDLLTLLFGFLGGMLCGITVLVSHRFLASGEEEPQE